MAAATTNVCLEAWEQDPLAPMYKQGEKILPVAARLQTNTNPYGESMEQLSNNITTSASGGIVGVHPRGCSVEAGGHAILVEPHLP